jgi:hypothetical protein
MDIGLLTRCHCGKQKKIRGHHPFILLGPNMKNKKSDMAVGQNLVPLVNIEIAGKWMFIPLKMVVIGIDPYPYVQIRPEKIIRWKLH